MFLNKITVVYIYVSIGIKMSVEVEQASDRTEQRYATLDEKVGLLVERMRECVRFVQLYMESRTSDQQLGDKITFGVMMGEFPVCIAKLSDIQEQMKGVRERGGVQKAPLMWKLKTVRATALGEACRDIHTFYNDEYGEVDEGHIRNEMRNLKTFRENLYPEWRFRGVGGFTKLDMTGGALIKSYNEERSEFVVVGEDAWTRCVVCFERSREVVLRPCNHACVCVDCRRKLGRCPICRNRIESSIRLEEAKREKIPYILSARGPWSEGYTRRLLLELQALGSEH
jgi:E3 ubiquitin-protein ligase XIAP/baculoviral IAP repeat-containing protein 2/3